MVSFDGRRCALAAKTWALTANLALPTAGIPQAVGIAVDALIPDAARRIAQAIGVKIDPIIAQSARGIAEVIPVQIDAAVADITAGVAQRVGINIDPIVTNTTRRIAEGVGVGTDTRTRAVTQIIAVVTLRPAGTGAQPKREDHKEAEPLENRCALRVARGILHGDLLIQKLQTMPQALSTTDCGSIHVALSGMMAFSGRGPTAKSCTI